MPLDGESIAIVLSLFLGLATAVMSFVFSEAVNSGTPAASRKEERWNEFVTVLEEMSRKAALTERAMKQLTIIKQMAEITLDNYDREREDAVVADH